MRPLLSWKCGLSPVAAREHVRVARALTGLPLIAAALRDGRLSYSCVRALTRVAEADTESDLLAVGLAGTVAHVERIVRGWRRADENAQPDPDSERFGVRLHWDDDGSLRLAGRLSAEDGALLLVALEAAQERLDRDRPAAGSADAGAGAGRGHRGLTVSANAEHADQGCPSAGSHVPRP